MSQPQGKREEAVGRYCVYVLLSFVLILFAFIRFRLRDMPLERDEGEYAYVGQLMLQGILPYTLAYTMKLPGTHAAYALILAFFGQTPAGVHFGLLLLNAGTTVLVYLLGARLSGRRGGLVSAASFALLSTSFSVLGFAAHATHFVIFFATAGILLLLRAIQSRQPWHYCGSGLLLGLAFVMKQPGIVFAVFGGLYLLGEGWRRSGSWRNVTTGIGCYVMGLLLPIGITSLILLIGGVYKTFWFWVFDYAREYGSEVSFSRGFQNFAEAFSRVVTPATSLWIIAALGLTPLLWNREGRRHAGFILGLLVFSFLGVCPGLFFRDHYFILILPVIALLAGIAVQSTTQVLVRAKGGILMTAVPALLFAAAFGYSLMQQRAFLFEIDPVLASQMRYRGNPFTEAIGIAEYIHAHTSRDDQIAVLGSEPEIYFYAKRHSATGFIYVYGLMEPQKYSFVMERQMIKEIELARPRFLVVVESPLSWLPQASPEAFDLSLWAKSYLESQYELVGISDRVDDHTEYHWENEAKDYRPRSQNTMLVFKRKTF